MLQDFKAFILRGNVIDLAIGVAIGAAFTAVISSFTENLLTPFLAIPGDAASFAEMDFEVSGSRFRYGAFIDSIIGFVIVAAVLFFFVVKPVNNLMARRKTEPEVESTTRDCPECLSSIPVAATRCAFCTAKVAVG
ncbi:MAG: large conductance mechanosensitive channel protein MscL [Actinobacteria bacterium]|nr:large conductance mechanosensitive channel protein MscL [Actinomycetota bacterium]